MTSRTPAPEAVWGCVVTLVATAALVAPMFWPLEADSFPLSTYPMFATSRGQPVLHRLVVERDDGTRSAVGPDALGTGEVLQAMAWLDRVARQPKQRAKLCRQVAAALATEGGSRRAKSIELQRVRFDPVDYFVSGPEPLELKVLERCEVPATAEPAREGPELSP